MIEIEVISMIKTLKDELYKYRKLILIYVSVCMVVAVLASPIFGTSDLINVHASDTVLNM